MTKTTTKKQPASPGIEKKSNLSSNSEPENIEEIKEIEPVKAVCENFSIDPALLEKMLKIGDGAYWNRILETFVGDMNRRYRR